MKNFHASTRSASTPSVRSVILICVLFACLFISAGWYIWSSLLSIERTLRGSDLSFEVDLYPLVMEAARLEESLRELANTPSAANQAQVGFCSDVLFYHVNHFPGGTDRLPLRDIEQVCTQIDGQSFDSTALASRVNSIFVDLQNIYLASSYQAMSRHEDEISRVSVFRYSTAGVGLLVIFSLALAGLLLFLQRRAIMQLWETARLREEVEAINRHDLKNPLLVVMNAPIAVLMDDNLTDKQRDLLMMVSDAGCRMLDMINRSIDLYRMESGTYSVNASTIDILKIVDRIKAALAGLMKEKSLRLHVASPHSSFPAKGEDLLVYSLLANLLKNAAEASPPGGQITIFLDDGESAEIAIHNMGAIPESIRDRFFQKFATAGKEHGSGLGAYSAKIITTTLGGTIACETSEEDGTTITVRLPKA